MNIVKLIPGSTGFSYSVYRSIFTSPVENCSKQFNKFRLIYRGTEAEKKIQKENPDRSVPNWSKGVRYPGYFVGNRFVLIPEAQPEIVVPDLVDCQFKPYVSYRTPDISTEEFKADDLFEAVYADKIATDFKNNKLDENGNPLEADENERLTPEEAIKRARRTGSDYFHQDIPEPKDIDEHNWIEGHMKVPSHLKEVIPKYEEQPHEPPDED